MTLTVDAIYENGVLRPLTPLDLPERQLVQVTILPDARALLEPYLDHKFIKECERYRDDPVTAEDIRKITASIPGSMSEVVREMRDDK